MSLSATQGRVGSYTAAKLAHAPGTGHLLQASSTGCGSGGGKRTRCATVAASKRTTAVLVRRGGGPAS